MLIFFITNIAGFHAYFVAGELFFVNKLYYDAYISTESMLVKSIISINFAVSKKCDYIGFRNLLIMKSGEYHPDHRKVQMHSLQPIQAY